MAIPVIILKAGQKIGQKILKMILSKSAKQMARKAGEQILNQGAALAAEKAIDKFFSDKRLTLDDKLAQLKKFKDSGEITRDQYEEYHKKLMDAHFA